MIEQGQEVNILYVKASLSNALLWPVPVGVTYGMFFEDDAVLVSDRVVYVRRYFRDYVKPLCWNMVHVICVAHGINLIDVTVHKSFPSVDVVVAEMKKAFQLSNGKCVLCKSHLEVCSRSEPKVLSAPVKRRWNPW